ncbi:hypothetical protein, partial [Acetobacter sp. DsW_063]|uniref:hypothetical protein n=1 Tax=Acetobacter sp. DsW_063 TaxID=1514894 RepID=UPI001E4C73CD
QRRRNGITQNRSEPRGPYRVNLLNCQGVSSANSGDSGDELNDGTEKILYTLADQIWWTIFPLAENQG